MEHKNYLLKRQYDFGTVFYYPTYVVGEIHAGRLVDTPAATAILSDINAYYKDNKMVYIANRELDHQVDLAVYALINPKQMVGIAIVAEAHEKRLQIAQEQQQYDGSFGFFKNMSSAISWAQLLMEQYK